MVLVGVALGKVAAFFLAVDLATTRFEDPTIGAAVDSLSKEDSNDFKSVHEFLVKDFKTQFFYYDR